MQKSKKDYVFVGIQIVIFLLYIFMPEDGSFSPTNLITFAGNALIGMGIIMVGIALFQLKSSLTPFPSPKETTQLLQSGIYGIVRHPIYSGIINVMFGYSLIKGDIVKLTIALAILILFYFKSKYEETLLTQSFPEYKLYKDNTGRFFPKVFKGGYGKLQD